MDETKPEGSGGARIARLRPGKRNRDLGRDDPESGFGDASESEAEPEIEAAGDAEGGGGFKRRDLFARLVEQGNIKPKLARDVAELVLAEIAAALARGEDVNLPPLGKIKVQKRKMQGTSEVLTLKLRLGGGGGKSGAGAAEERLADPDD